MPNRWRIIVGFWFLQSEEIFISWRFQKISNVKKVGHAEVSPRTAHVYAFVEMNCAGLVYTMTKASNNRRLRGWDSNSGLFNMSSSIITQFSKGMSVRRLVPESHLPEFYVCSSRALYPLLSYARWGIGMAFLVQTPTRNQCIALKPYTVRTMSMTLSWVRWVRMVQQKRGNGSRIIVLCRIVVSVHSSVLLLNIMSQQMKKS